MLNSTETRTPRKGGAPRGNTNALIHGRCTKRPRIWRGLSKQRPELANVERDCNALCKQLEDDVLAAVGVIDVAVASAIDAAVGWEFHGGMARHHLEAGNLSPTMQIQFSREWAQAKANRNRIIATLPIRKPSDPHDVLRRFIDPDDLNAVRDIQRSRQAKRSPGVVPSVPDASESIFDIAGDDD